MSNRVTLQYTEFVNLDQYGTTTSSSFGYRVYDNYGSNYNNCYDSLEEVKEAIGEDVFEFIKENHSEYFESIEMSGGMYFNDCWTEYKEEEEEEV